MIKMYGTEWCSDCKRSRKFLAQQNVQYVWVDIDQDPEAAKTVESFNQGRQKVPTIVFEDGSILVEPPNAALATKLGLSNANSKNWWQIWKA